MTNTTKQTMDQLHHDDEIICLRHEPERDPDGALFGQMLKAHLALERAREFRALLALVLAVITFLGALQLLPHPAVPRLQALVGAGWAICFVALCAATFSERRWGAERTRCLSEFQPQAGRMEQGCPRPDR